MDGLGVGVVVRLFAIEQQSPHQPAARLLWGRERADAPRLDVHLGGIGDAAALEPGDDLRVGPGYGLARGVFGRHQRRARIGYEPPGQQGSGRERHDRFVGRVLPRFQQDDECLPRHRGARARVGGLSWCRTIRRSEGHLVFGRLVQAHRDESRVGTHRLLSPEDLYRLPDLALRPEDRADGGSGPHGARQQRPGCCDPCPLCGALPLAFPPAGRTPPRPTAQPRFIMTCLTCVSSAVVRLEGHDCFIGACGLPEILAGPSRRFRRLCVRSTQGGKSPQGN